MAPRIPTPSTQGVSPLGDVPLTLAPQTPIQNISADFSKVGLADEKSLARATKGFSAFGTAVADAAVAADKRKLAAYDIAVSEMENELLNKGPWGLNTLTGNAALSRINGTHGGPIFVGGGDKPQETINQEYQRRLGEIAEQHGLSKGSGNDAVSIAMGQRQATFNNSVSMFGTQAQALADEQTITTRIANISERMRVQAGSAVARKRALGEVKNAVLDPHIGLAKAAGLNPNTTDAEQRKLVDQLIQTAEGKVYEVELNSLINQNKLTLANEVFREATRVDGGPLVGEARDTIQKQLLALNDVQNYTVGFEIILAKNTAQEDIAGDAEAGIAAVKQGDINWKGLYDDILSEDDGAKQEAMMKLANGWSSSRASITRKQQAASDKYILKHVLIDNKPISKIPPAILAGASPSVKEGLFTGLTAVKRSKNQEAAGDRAGHIDMGGAPYTPNNNLSLYMEMAQTDPREFLDETADEATTRPLFGFTDYNKVMTERTKVLGRIEKAEVEAVHGIKFKSTSALIERFLGKKKGQAYDMLRNNAQFTSEIDRFRIQYVKEKGVLPSDEQVFKAVAPLLIDVYEEEPGRDFFGVGLHPAIGGTAAGPFIAQEGAQPSALDNKFVDVSSDRDRKQLSRAFETTKEAIEEAVEALSNKGISNPTVKQLRVQLGGIDKDTTDSPGSEDPVAAKNKRQFEDLAVVAGFTGDFLLWVASMTTQGQGPLPLNVISAAELIAQLKRDPAKLELAKQGYAQYQKAQ